MSQIATFNRSDTLLGVCEALGQDFRFNPLWLRLALTLGLFWNPAAILVLYVALAAVVYLTRWLTPVRATAEAPEPSAAVPADNDVEPVEMQLAA